MHTVKPLDEEAVLLAARETRALFTLEEHSVIGGLGGAVAEVLAEHSDGLPVFRRFGLPSAFAATAGTQEFLRAQHGLCPESLAAEIRTALEKLQLLADRAGA
jgi:transketolase